MTNPSNKILFSQLGALAALGLAVGFSSVANAENVSHNHISNRPANSITSALAEGTPSLAFRARIENVDRDDTPAGHANTLMTKLSYLTANFYDFSGFLEFANTTSYWNAHHNSGNLTTPSRGQYAVIPDAKGSALTRSYLAYTGFDNTEVLLGRQVVRLDNQRFVGKSDFRQMPTTFDGLTISNHSLPCVDLFVGQLFQIHTNYQNDSAADNGSQKLRTFIANATWSGLQAGKLTAYGILNNNRSIRRFSQDTYGLRWAGNYGFSSFDVLYTLEYAHQHANHNRPLPYTAIYKMADAMIKYDVYGFRVGYEALGGDKYAANRSFVTPLASLHEFQGWADQFVVTPNRGVKDIFAELTGTYGDYKGILAYHNFRAEDGSLQLGNEWDIGVSRRFNDQYEAKFEYANFDRTKQAALPINGNYRDVTKIWLSFIAKFS